MDERTAEALWQDYLFLTKEMLKFLDREDMELFHELMDQRERMQSIIDETPDNGFRVSSQGRSLLAEIAKENQVLMNSFQTAHQRVKKHHQVAEAYGGVSQSPVSQRTWNR